MKQEQSVYEKSGTTSLQSRLLLNTYKTKTDCNQCSLTEEQNINVVCIYICILYLYFLYILLKYILIYISQYVA